MAPGPGNASPGRKQAVPITMGSGPDWGRNHLESLCPRLRVKAIEPGLVDLGDDSEADLLVAHEVAELVAVDEVDGRCRDCGGLAGGGRESSQGYQYGALR